MERVAVSWTINCGVSFQRPKCNCDLRRFREGRTPKMAQRDPERYTQGDDGLIVEKVGQWAINKLKILTDYVYASGGARKNFARHGPGYIDVFCGPGRSLIRGTNQFIEGSPIAAFKRALESPGQFSSINVSDADDELLTAAEKRLKGSGAPVRAFSGPASTAMPKIVQ